MPAEAKLAAAGSVMSLPVARARALAQWQLAPSQRASGPCRGAVARSGRGSLSMSGVAGAQELNGVKGRFRVRDWVLIRLAGRAGAKASPPGTH